MMQQKIKEFWDRRGAMDNYAEPVLKLRNDAERHVWLVTLRDLLPPAPADVVDLGTGTGFLAFFLAELGHRITGVDLSDGMLRVAKERALGTDSPIAFITGDGTDPPLNKANWDVVANRNMLWTLLDPKTAFDNWRE